MRRRASCKSSLTWCSLLLPDAGVEELTAKAAELLVTHSELERKAFRAWSVQSAECECCKERNEPA
jgi:hypothetical protein